VTVAVALVSLIAACASSGAADPAGNAAATSNSSTSSATRTESFPVTVHAANGRVTIASRPTSIVSLSPTATEMLYAIGAGAQVSAVDKDSDYPRTVPRTTLNSLNLNVEAIARYHPDLVVASDLTAAQLAQLNELGIAVVKEPAVANMAQVYQQLVQLGTVTGHLDGANAEVAGMRSRIAHIIKATPATHATYYYELDQTYYSETSSTFIGQVLGLLGLHSIADSASGAASSGGYPQLSAEFILKSNPDYVLLADTICCKQSAATVAARPGWSTLTAVHHGRVVALNDDIASRWGPRIVDLLSDVSRAIRLHPAGTR
jgi:iron complex transport system substrate-binding protein